MNTEKRLQKIKRLHKVSNEPTTDAFNYRVSLGLFLNYHNAHTSSSTIKKWAETHFESVNLVPPNVHEREFRTLGLLVHLVDIDAYLEQKELDKINEEVDRIMNLKPSVDEETTEQKTEKIETMEANIQKRASEFIGEFEGLIDDFMTEGKYPDTDSLISLMDISSRVSPRIQEYAKTKVDYYKMVVEDKEALSYYSQSKPVLKKVAVIWEELYNKLSQKKKIRVPRKTKEKPAGVLVKNLKYLIKDEELGIRSVNPTLLIGSTEAYLFRADGRKLQYFKSLDGSTLTVKGTTILNYDESKSFQKTVRKPEILKDLVGKGKLDSRRFFKDIKATEQKISGRTNEQTLILIVHK